LAKPHVKADGERADYCRLEAHLRRYTARNTFDYFIHKDLGGFLRRELDFYVKNEVMHLDDVENETAPRVEQYLSKIKVIRRIAGKIINFLAQLEDFQKKLWVKKKFVVETQYCITLNCIPEAFYPKIAANDAQRNEWVHLFAIDEIERDLRTTGYSDPLTVAFLTAHPTLVVDTRHFDSDFGERLLDAIADLDAQTDGLLVHSENFQALSLMRTHCSRRVQCIYIDPPYNTGNDEFIYRDNYQHSSWLTMVSQTLWRASTFMDQGSSFFVSCDDNENPRLRECLDECFGARNFESQIIVQSNKRGQTYKSIAKTHEYLLVYDSDEKTTLNGLPREVEDGLSDEYGPYELWELRNRNPKFGRFNRPNLFFPIYVSTAEYEEKGYSTVSTEPTSHFTIPVCPRNSSGADSCWRWSVPKVLQASAKGDRVIIAKQVRSGEWRIWEKSRKSVKAPKSIWTDTGVINEKGTVEVGALGLNASGFPKPLGLLTTVVQIGTNDGDTLLDYFAGTGTTGHAVVSLNREDGGRRRFFLVEMAAYFDTVLLPRVKKVTFTPEWKDGKPARLVTAEEAERSPRIVKVIRLESYEDALNNLELRRPPAQRSLLDTAEAQGADKLKEQYILRYMLDVETRGSQSLLNVQAFTDPTAYKLKVKRPGSDESREVNVDLLETFNWLIGLTVRHIAAPTTFSARFNRDDDPDLSADSPRRLLLDGRLREKEDGPWWFRTVTGTTPDGRKTLVIWRKRPGGESAEGIEQDNLVLDEWFTKQGYSSKDSEFDLIYVNGSNNLENLKAPDDTWKVRLIEEDFHRLMFADAEE
jgi:adenine-specific DNA-methyltransferase